MTCMHTNFYDRRIAPALVTAGCSMRTFSRIRQGLIPQAEGVVVEVGFGSGINLAYYDPAKVSRLIGVDRCPRSVTEEVREIGSAPHRISTLRATQSRDVFGQSRA